MIQYQYDESKIIPLEKYSLNLDANDWASQEVTGIIEDDSRIWMHPFRQNQYNFMEVAPFPQVHLPLEVGTTWEATLTIHNWGVWSDSKVESLYEVLAYEQITLEVGAIDAWHVFSNANASFGNSTHNFWFHPELGFVKMVVNNYTGQILQIELEDIVEQ